MDDQLPLLDVLVEQVQLDRIEDAVMHISAVLYQVKPRSVQEQVAVSLLDISTVLRELRSAR